MLAPCDLSVVAEIGSHNSSLRSGRDGKSTVRTVRLPSFLFLDSARFSPNTQTICTFRRCASRKNLVLFHLFLLFSHFHQPRHPLGRRRFHTRPPRHRPTRTTTAVSRETPSTANSVLGSHFLQQAFLLSIIRARRPCRSTTAPQQTPLPEAGSPIPLTCPLISESSPLS